MEVPVSSIPPAMPPGPPGPSREPMSTAWRRGILAFVIFFHVGGGWALTQVEPVKLIVGDIAPMEVRMVPAEEPAQPDIPFEEPPPVEIPPPPVELATVIDPPPPDLPPPEFPVEAKPPDPPPEQKPPPPKPPPPRPVQKPRPAAPAEPTPQQAAPAAPATPHVVDASQLGYLVQPRPVYPKRAERAGEQGKVFVRVLIDITGRPAQVSLEKSSGFPDLDQAALTATRAAQFRPYMVGGLARAVIVIVPINFVVPK